MIRRRGRLSTERDFEVNIWSRIGQALLPPSCALCGAHGEGLHNLCSGCTSDLLRNAHACAGCGLPLKGEPAARCGRCLRHPPPFDAFYAPFLYTPPLSHLITGLKFRARLSHARLLGQLLAAAIPRAIPAAIKSGFDAAPARPDCLLPVPLHPQRLRQRGFNQALEIARPLSAVFGIPLRPGLLRRVRATPAQSDLPARRRRANVRGAFAYTGTTPAARHVVLIDDVVTTGHTVAELARVLRRAGAERIEVWAVARAVSD